MLEKKLYYFNGDYLKVQVDSTVADHQVDLIVKLKRKKLLNCKFKYKLRHCIPNYSIGSDSLILLKHSTYKDFTIIDSENLFKPNDEALFQRDFI
jgi:hypothetical protein